MYNDIRYALRRLQHQPGFALTAILSIAMAVGANSALFSFQDGLLLRPLAVARPSEVASVIARNEAGQRESFAYADYRDFQEKNHTFQGLVTYRIAGSAAAITAEEQPQVRVGMIVSGNFFDVFGVKPALGRTFRPDEDQVPGRDAVVVISYDYWRTGFGADPSVVGKHLRLGPRAAENFTIVGVAPEAFTGVDLFVRPAFYVPAMMTARLLGEPDAVLAVRERDGPNSPADFQVKGRMNPGVSPQTAEADIASIEKALETSFPTYKGRTIDVMTERQSRLNDSPILGGIVNVVFGIMILILLIACANVANLMLARGRARAREIGVRVAIGASRARLVRQLMTENLMIALVGGALGLVIAQLSARFFSSLELVGDAPIKFVFEVDRRVLWFTLGVSFLSAVLFGLFPALTTANADPATTMKTGDTAPQRTRFALRSVLVVVQVTGSLVMLMAAAQLYMSTTRVLAENPGFSRDHRITVRLNPEYAGYTLAQTSQFQRTLVERAHQLPGVKSAGFSDTMALTTDLAGWQIAPEGFDFPDGKHNVSVMRSLVDENYFSTLNVPILTGRAFRASDDANSPKVAIVNSRLADRFFKGDAIGKRIRIDAKGGEWAEIVGVAATGKYNFITEPPQPYFYLPSMQYPQPRATLIVETAGDPAAMAKPLRDLITSIDPNMPVFSVRTMEDAFEHGPINQLLIFNGVFSGTSLMGFVLAVVGLYAVVAYQASRRTREIGIRIALGAAPSQVLRMVLGQGALLAGIGIVLGIVLSIALRPLLLVSMGRPVSGFDPLMITCIPLSLLLITLAASAIPARRAARIDPQQALRQD